VATATNPTQKVVSVLSGFINSVQGRLTILVLACITPAVVMVMALIFYYHQQDVAQRRVETMAKAQSVVTDLNNRMTSVVSALQTLASSELLTAGDFSGFHRRAQDVMRSQRLATITLVTAQGQQLLNTAVPYGQRLPKMDQPQIMRLAQGGKTGFVDLFDGRVLGKRLVAVVVPIRQANGDALALTAALTTDNVRELLTQPDLPAEWPAAIIDTQGIVIARSISPEKFVGQPARAELLARMRQMPQGVFDSVTLEGTPVVTAFSRSSLTNWSVAIGLPRSALTSRLQKSLALLLGGTALLVIGGLALAHGVASRITRTIKALMAQAGALGRGEKITPVAMDFQEAESLSAALSRAADQLDQTKAALVRRNLDLQQFAFVASHDLRVPLKTVNGYLSLLRRRFGSALDPKALDLLERTNRAVVEMDQLTLDLLAYARMDSSAETRALLSCEALVADTLGFLDGAIQETQAQIHVGPLPSVVGDRSQLIQLFQNLLSNALTYRQAAVAPVIHISAVRGVGEWVFSVADNGIGIDPAHHQKIFEVFKRLHTSQEYRGHGIGLAVCQRVVERHGGRLWVTSARGEGSTFHFSIPDSPSTAP
jgi:signal transduction histidine kinase